MTDILEQLAVKVEALDGSDREVELEIWAFLYPDVAADCARDGKAPLPWLHCYTASLDAAMTLVPEGWFTSDFHQGPSGGNWWKLSNIRDGQTYYTSVAGMGKQPALALVAAALRAKDASNG